MQADLFSGFSEQSLENSPCITCPDPSKNLLPQDGIVYDFGEIIPKPELLYQALLQTSPWQSDIVTLFGKTHVTRRQVVWMGDTLSSYHYSGHTRHSVAWSPEVVELKQKIEKKLAEQGLITQFNACLLNYYPSGEDGLGYHADNESELGYQPIIASMSLGAERKFVFKHRTTKAKVEIRLRAGQLIVMAGDTQQYWLHSLPKTKKVSEGRINLTFRTILPR